jgi:ribosomal protein S18 acetylase RimI-like enzyme
MPKSECLEVERLAPPYRAVEVRVHPEQEQFIDPVGKAISIMTAGEVPFVVRFDGEDVGFFTLRPSADDEVEQLRSANRCTLRSFMIDAGQQGKGFASRALAELPGLVPASFPAASSIGLTVNCRNTQAYRLYEKNGFRDIGELYHGGSAGPQHIMVMDLVS